MTSMSPLPPSENKMCDCDAAARLENIQLETRADFLGLLISGKYSDFQIVCGAEVWKVHKAIICARSEYFERVCDSNFKEAAEGSITLEGEHPDLVNQMIHWLYTYKYIYDSHSEISPQRLINHVEMYMLADKYDLRHLKSETRWAFQQDIEGFVDRCKVLSEVIRLVYDTLTWTEFGPRDLLTSFIWRNKETLLLEPEIQACVRECEGLRQDILEELYRDVRKSTVRYTDDGGMSFWIESDIISLEELLRTSLQVTE